MTNDPKNLLDHLAPAASTDFAVIASRPSYDLSQMLASMNAETRNDFKPHAIAVGAEAIEW